MKSEDELEKIIYGMSHDMGAPLRSIVQFSKLLLRSLEGRLSEKEAYWFQLILDNGQQAQAMIDALIQLSRIKPDEETAAPFNVAEMVAAATSLLSTQIKESSANIERAGDACEWEGNAAQLRQCVYELVRNALIFQPENNVPQVRIHWKKHNGVLTICVEDNGIGAREDQREKMVYPFQRLNGVTLYPGLGMGLAVCNRIVQNHGGEIHFRDSNLGGLAVTIEFEGIQS